MNLKTRMEVERRIATKIVEDALSLGLYITVNNGGDENEICLSSCKEGILDNMFAAEIDRLMFFSRVEGAKKEFNQVGWVTLIYGNGYDVISDYVDNSLMIPVLKGAADLADQLEKVST